MALSPQEYTPEMIQLREQVKEAADHLLLTYEDMAAGHAHTRIGEGAARLLQVASQMSMLALRVERNQRIQRLKAERGERRALTLRLREENS